MARSTGPNLHNELVNLLSQHGEDGASDQLLRDHFGARYEGLVAVINDLLRSNRLQLFYQGTSLIYKLITESVAAKFEGLGPEQIMVFQVCERAGNRGIWTRDIKSATNLPQLQLAKTLKTLEQRCLIKSVRSITSKSKKLYMLYDAIPTKDITGGPWYVDQEFDHEFVARLHAFIVDTVAEKGMASLAYISDKVRSSGISRVDLSSDELDLVIKTLVYDNKLEEVTTAVAMMMAQQQPASAAAAAASGHTALYKISPPIVTGNALTDIPCGKCPVISRCSVGGVISPSTCLYLKEWLAMPDTPAHPGGSGATEAF